MNLNEIHFFRAVAEAGSFTQASRQFGVPKSTLSRKVAELETRLGVTLIRRSTRRVQLTEIGLNYLRACQKAIAALELAEADATRSSELPKGKLRIAAPFDLGTTYLAGITREFVDRCPEVEVDLLLSDQLVDLIEDRVDLAVRAGPLEDSSLKAIRLGMTEFQLFAAPSYLRAHGEPRTPRELESHRCIFFRNLSPDGAWRLTSGSQEVWCRPGHRIFCDSLNMAKQLAMSGAGIALIPVFLGHDEVQKNRLSRIIKNWGTDREPLHAVYPDQPYLPQKTRVFLECLKKAFD